MSDEEKKLGAEKEREYEEILSSYGQSLSCRGS